jgi:hypothetical protein
MAIFTYTVVVVSVVVSTPATDLGFDINGVFNRVYSKGLGEEAKSSFYSANSIKI